MSEEVAQANPQDGDIDRRVLAIVAEALDADPETVTAQTSLEADLGAESLDFLDIAFMLEREFNVRFPRTDFLERAADHFGEENLVKGEVISPLGLKLLAKGMPELDPEQLKPGLKVTDVRRMIVAGTFVRVTKRLMEARQTLDPNCPKCGTKMDESSSIPELDCPSCGEVTPFPSGDDFLFQDMLALEDDVRGPASEPAGDEAS